MASEKKNATYRRYNVKSSVYYGITLSRLTNAELVLRLEEEKAAGRSMAADIKAAVLAYDAREKEAEAEPGKRGKSKESPWVFSLKLNRRTDALVIEKIEAAKERGESAMGFIKRALYAYFGL